MSVPHVDVKSLKVAELKEELVKRGLDTKGLKKDLADRLQAAQDAGTSQDEGNAAASASGSRPASSTAKSDTESAPGPGEEQGVGSSMLDGYPENIIDSNHLRDPTIPLDKDAVTLEPAALDAEVAEGIAREEAKELLTPSPSPPTRLSPLPVGENSTQESKSHGVKEITEGQNEDTGDGVGKSMVDGYPENPSTAHHPTPPPPARDEVALQPGALDEEVARGIAEEEAKERLSSTPSPPRALSPLPASAVASTSTSPGRMETKAVADAEDGEGEDMQLDLDDEEEAEAKTKEESSTRSQNGVKRARSPSPSLTRPDADVKRARISLPSSLSHLPNSHPPTSVLYITNLRRPLVHSSLHGYLQPSVSSTAHLPEPTAPFGSKDYPGLWLSGVKDHAYATYEKVEDAITVAEKVQGKNWPEDTGEELHVFFVPEERVLGLVEREELAWKNGRQKLTLKITPSEDGEEKGVEQGWKFELVGSGGLGLNPPPRGGVARDPLPVAMAGGSGRIQAQAQGPRAVPLTGVNAIRPGQGGSRAPLNGNGDRTTGPGVGMGIGIGIRGRAFPAVVPGAPTGPAQREPRAGGGPKNGRERERDEIRNGELRGWAEDRPAQSLAIGYASRDDRDEKRMRFESRMRPTKFMPRLFWKKGPGAATASPGIGGGGGGIAGDRPAPRSSPSASAPWGGRTAGRRY